MKVGYFFELSYISTKVAVFPEKNATSCWLSSGTSTHFWKFHINKELHTKDIFLVKDVIFHQTYAGILIQRP